MDEWKPLDLTTENMDHEVVEPSVPEGLETDAASLQAHFEASNDHLMDVRQRHAEVLVTAGMLPKWQPGHLPERALAWVVEGINGRISRWSDDSTAGNQEPPSNFM